MKKHCNEEEHPTDFCARQNATAVWIMGIGAIVVITIAVLAMFGAPASSRSPAGSSGGQLVALYGQSTAPAVGFSSSIGAAQQAAFPSGCATCPNLAQCFPQSALGQQAAYSPPGRTGLGGAAGSWPTQQGAWTQTPPAIFRDALMPHGYRGVCSNCHTIRPDVPIPANAVMPHSYRGVCSNCHTIQATNAGSQIVR